MQRIESLSLSDFPIAVHHLPEHSFSRRYQGTLLPNFDPTNFVCTDAGLQIEAFVPSLECPFNNGPIPLVGDPCDVASREYFAAEPDYLSPILPFTRYYHSSSPPAVNAGFGAGGGWFHNYAATLNIASSAPVLAIRPDGHRETFTLISGVYKSSASGLRVLQSGSDWVAYRPDGTTEVYNSSGQLIQIVSPTGLAITLSYSGGLLSTVADPFGHTLQFAYDSQKRLSSVIEPDGASTIAYGYDTNSNLISATYPDNTTRQYQYQNATFATYLTGIVDESGTQFESIQYDSLGQVTSSQLAGGALAVSISYPTVNSAVVTDSLNATTTYQFTANSYGAPRATSVQRNSLVQSYVVPSISADPQQRVTKYTDPNGNVTTYSYDSNHLTSETEAAGTSIARTTNYAQYQDALTTLPTLVTEALRQTSYVYYPNTYRLQTKTITDTTVTPNVSRIWNYTYNSSGKVLTVDGPRTDVSDITTYAYFACTTGVQCGQVNTVTSPSTSNAPSGLVTTYLSYDAHGQPLTFTDPNGVLTTLGYDLRQRLASRQVGSELTQIAYFPNGLLQKVTLPDGSYLQYGYDNAHRLTDITDTLGNRIHYTLDAMGNRTAESTKDPSGTLSFTQSRVFNSLNELYQQIASAGTAAVTTTFGYDNNGNSTSITAPLSRSTGNLFDQLNRLSQATDPANGVAKYSYDANDNLSSVTDPRGLITAYTNDGFGELTQLVSPDTGTTNKTYDSAGNLKTSTDARGAVGSYTYDALNRLTQVQFLAPDPSQIPTVTKIFVYDNCTNGKGRLCEADDLAGKTLWTYTPQGRIASRSEVDGNSPVAPGFTPATTYNLSYTYNSAGQRTTMQFPSAAAVNYSYNGNNQISAISVTVGGTTTPVVSNVTYEPFGAIRGWMWGNGATVIRAHNTDGSLSVISSRGLHLSYQYDDAQRISGITDNDTSDFSWSYGYDSLDRLTSAASLSIAESWTYDANGNRLSQSVTGDLSPGYFTYNPNWTFSYNANNNQFQASSTQYNQPYDAAGNIQGSPYSTPVLHDAEGNDTAGGNLEVVFNAVRQSVAQVYSGAAELRRVYDDLGHAIAEYVYEPLYNPIALLPMQETVWLGDIPVAVILAVETYDSNGNVVDYQRPVYYIHTDHLNTPRRLTHNTDNVVAWRWDSDPFGVGVPESTQSPYPTYRLRFPGQLFESQTGFYQNGLREYDPTTGRYQESDPIGLYGGSYSTYAYANGSPLYWSDRFGLKPGDKFPVVSGNTSAAIQAAAVDALNWVYQAYPNANYEYAGTIYPDGQGNYVATDPITQYSKTSSIPSYPKDGRYARIEAYYHTHGQCTKGMHGGDDIFSDSDKINADYHNPLQVPNFLETPGHKILRYDPDPTKNLKGTVTTIQSGCDCPKN